MTIKQIYFDGPCAFLRFTEGPHSHPICPKLFSRIRYWLAWKLAGKRIYNKGVMWASSNIYLYSCFPRLPGDFLITLPEDITVADEPVILSSGTIFDGGHYILTQAVNKKHKATIEVPAGVQGVSILNTWLAKPEPVEAGET